MRCAFSWNFWSRARDARSKAVVPAIHPQRKVGRLQQAVEVVAEPRRCTATNTAAPPRLAGVQRQTHQPLQRLLGLVVQRQRKQVGGRRLPPAVLRSSRTKRLEDVRLRRVDRFRGPPSPRIPGVSAPSRSRRGGKGARQLEMSQGRDAGPSPCASAVSKTSRGLRYWFLIHQQRPERQARNALRRGNGEPVRAGRRSAPSPSPAALTFQFPAAPDCRGGNRGRGRAPMGVVVLAVFACRCGPAPPPHPPGPARNASSPFEGWGVGDVPASALSVSHTRYWRFHVVMELAELLEIGRLDARPCPAVYQTPPTRFGPSVADLDLAG